LRKVAKIEDQATDKVVERIAFRKSKGVGEIELAPSITHDRRNFERHLRDAGAILPRDKKATADLLDRVANDEAPKSFLYAARCGWSEGLRTFILPEDAIGASADGVIGINPVISEGHGTGNRSERGTWKTWRDQVARPAGQSSILMYAISLGFAGPLLGPLHRESRTVVLFGPSRSGKTTATLAAASVIGVASQAEMPNWNLTDARLEQQLPLFNDCLFPIDDFATLGGKPAEAYQRLRDLAYRLHQGWGRGRHSSFTSGNTAREQWRVIGLTSSELSIREFAQAAKRQRQAGESVRLIDVPMLVDGEQTLFDRAERPLSRTESVDIIELFTQSIRQNHGAVFRRQVRNIIKHRHRIKSRLNKKIRGFSECVREENDGPLARDVADTFGVAYAAGAFAIACKLLPWRESDLLDAIRKIYNATKKCLPDEGSALRDGLKSLHSLLKTIRHSAQLGIHEIDFDKVRGICKSKRSQRRYLIKNEGFSAIFATLQEKTLVLNWLCKKGRITLVGSRQAPREDRKAREQFDWPDGRRRRSFEIRWPRKAVERRKGKNKARANRAV
jgi:hypothetical protein